MDPRVLAQLFLAALGRGDHPDSETNPVYALYQVALDYRCSAETRQSLADIAKFPFTVKNDLRDNYPFGMFAVPQSEIVRLHANIMQLVTERLERPLPAGQADA